MKRLVKSLFIIFAIALFQPLSGITKELAQDYTQPAQPNESDLQEHGHYTNKSGNVVHSSAHSVSGAVPKGASAQCRDGSYSFSQNHRGTCSHHGGVSQWLN